MTPAREYYGSQIDDGLDPSEQWNRKKQTKEQKRAAKKAKLDPANQKSALDVMKDRENKRKRELGLVDEDEAEGDADALAPQPDGPSNKRQKQELDDEERAAKAAKRREARHRKKEKENAKKAKAEAKKARKAEAVQLDAADVDAQSCDEDVEDAEPVTTGAGDKDMAQLDIQGLADSDDEQNDPKDAEEGDSSTPSSPAADSPAFDISTNHSEASSSSSIVPPSFPEKATRKVQQKPLPKFELGLQTKASTTQATAEAPSGTESPKLRLPDIDQAELQERLRKKIEDLRARRKADGPDGRPARSRQELLDQRRQKEEQRKVHKKELRRAAKEEEARKREEQLRGSGSPLSMELFGSRPSPRPQENNFSFGRVAFDDGTAADASLSTLTDPRKKKGPSDVRTALQAAEKKQSRLAGLDAEKRADIAEKDMWLNAKKHAHGERVRDDTNLLKKALKRKEKQKNKSEKQWQEREEAIVKGKEAKQKRREANLKKRKEEKNTKGKKKPSAGSKGKKKARPGFEGRFKA